MKNIVVCYDGTNANYGHADENTNVVRLFERLGKDGAKQVSFYDPGVGTISPQKTQLRRLLHKGLQAAFGIGVRSNVLDAYQYLMDVYEPEDNLYLFGYSRGAHTARRLADMLHRCGLLTRGSLNLLPYTTRVYDQSNSNEAARFKAAFSRECKPHFIGVWDTVASMGYLCWRKFFRDQALNPDVRHGFQALALNERRSYFDVSLWDERDIPECQEIVQVWFPGYHSDIGGQKSDRRISDITLEWMLRHASERGLLLKDDWHESLQPDPVAGQLSPSDRHVFRVRASDRRVPDGAKIHRSVFDRREDAGVGYTVNNLPELYDVVE